MILKYWFYVKETLVKIVRGKCVKRISYRGKIYILAACISRTMGYRNCWITGLVHHQSAGFYSTGN